MSNNESNWAGNMGSQNPYNTQDQFKQGGMTDTQAQEAWAAAQRLLQQQSGEKR